MSFTNCLAVAKLHVTWFCWELDGQRWCRIVTDYRTLLASFVLNVLVREQAKLYFLEPEIPRLKLRDYDTYIPFFHLSSRRGIVQLVYQGNMLHSVPYSNALILFESSIDLYIHIDLHELSSQSMKWYTYKERQSR